MSDLRRLLRSAAAAPSEPLDPSVLPQRADRRRRRRLAVVASSGAAALVLLVAVTAVALAGNGGSHREVVTDGGGSNVDAGTGTSDVTADTRILSTTEPFGSGGPTTGPDGTSSIGTTPAPSVVIVPPDDTSPGTIPEATTTATTPPSTVGPPLTGTGVYGHVTRGPMCPVEYADGTCGNGQPADAPVAGALVQVLRSGSVVIDAYTDESGRFQFGLAPGEYTLRASTDQAMFCRDVTVTVIDGSYTTQDIDCDTGIR